MESSGHRGDSPSDELKLEVELLAAAQAAESTAEMDSQVAPPGPFRVLVVDDDSDMRSYIMRCLGTEEEIDTLVEVENGAEAMAHLRRGSFDLVVCDVVMPVMDGIELCRAIREDEGLAGTGVLLVTGELTSRSAREGALEAGAIDVLTKPFNAQTLCDRVLHLLRSRAPPGP